MEPVWPGVVLFMAWVLVIAFGVFAAIGLLKGAL